MRFNIRLSAILLFLFVGLPSPAAASAELVFLNWSDYMDPEILEEFRKRTGIRVKQTYFDADTARDELLLETEGKGYDLAIVDGITLRVLAKRGWLEPISVAEIPNLKHIDPRWRSAQEKAEDYGVPYFWGTTGIAYREDLVPGPVKSWMQLFRPDETLLGKIGMISDATDMVGTALKALGHSLNSADTQHMKEVEALLNGQAPYVKTYRYVSLTENSAMVNGEVAMSMMYSGDALMVQEHNENITYVLPEEGGNIWIDYLCVLSASSNKPAAKRFIDFLNEPEIAARLAEFVYYATPNQAAETFLPKEYFQNPVIYPSGPALEKSEFYRPLAPRAEKRRSALFSRIVH